MFSLFLLLEREEEIECNLRLISQFENFRCEHKIQITPILEPEYIREHFPGTI